MRYEDYKARRDARKQKHMLKALQDKETDNLIKHPGELTSKELYALLYLFTPSTAASIFWDAFEVTQHAIHEPTREYAKRIMAMCKAFYDQPENRLTQNRINFYREVNDHSEQTLLEAVEVSELLTGTLYERIDNLEDF